MPTLPTFHKRYIAGECQQIWDELLALGPDVRKPTYYDDALAVARETMQRVRRNCQILIPRLQQLGWRFGYEWARVHERTEPWIRSYFEREIAEQPPLLGEPTPTTILDNIEANNGPLPIALRSFYETVGAINFVGTPFDRPDWPDIEDGLDPLYIAGIEQAFGHKYSEYDDVGLVTYDTGDAFVPRWRGRVTIAPCFLHKYFISGVGSEYMEIPALYVDAPLMFEDGPLEMEGRDLTLVRYLRYAIQGGGFLAFMPGWKPDTMPTDDLRYLTEGLWPI